MRINKRPQPIGIFPLPANYLLVADTSDGTEPSVGDLMRGIVPKEDSYYRFAIEGFSEVALAELPDDDSPETQYNRFILDSSPEAYEKLRSTFTGEMAALLDVAAFTLNFTKNPPEDDGLDGELKAFVLMAKATHQFEEGDIEEGINTLTIAAEAAKPASPVFHAQILSSLAETLHQFFGANATVIQTYKNALSGLRSTDLEAAKAAINMNLGICYQEMAGENRGALLEAVKCYQESLKYYSREKFPEEFAFVQNNLALAYLSIPLTEASDQLRIAIAIQALREALTVYKRETHPELWASTQLNLANALQYAPSSHVETNLEEAVNLYEEILSVRSPESNPVGYARLLANQGNALAHLGIFVHAVPKLAEAKRIFEATGDEASAASIQEVLSEIEMQRGQATVS